MPAVGLLGKTAAIGGSVAAFYPFRWLVRCLPREAAFAVARASGRLGGSLPGAGVARRARQGVRLFYGDELDEAGVERIVSAHLAARGQGFVEALVHDLIPPEAWKLDGGWLEVEGFEHLERLRDEGRGAVLTSLHYGPFRYLMSVMAGNGVPCGMFVNPFIHHEEKLGKKLGGRLRRIKEETDERARRLWGDRGRFIYIEGAATVRQLIKMFRESRVVMIPNADGPDGNRFVEGSLLGRRMWVPTATATIARAGKVPLVPALAMRAGNKLRVVVGEPIEVARGDEEEATVRALSWFDPHFAAAPWDWWCWVRLEKDPESAGRLKVGGIGDEG